MLKPNKSNPRFVDTPETATIKPIDPTYPKDLIIEDLDMSLDEYLRSIGMGDEPLAGKTGNAYKSRNRTKN